MSHGIHTGLNRDTIDKYYTIESTVNICINLIKKTLPIQKNDLCIEPSAGNGAFIESIESLSDHSLFYDIQPEAEKIVKQDYLTFDYKTHISSDIHNIHIIGNPPFGRQSTCAIKFIKHSVKFCHSISFILPKSFKKDSMKRHFPLFYHLECEVDIPAYSFNINNNKHDVPCVFQIWIKKDTPRYIPLKLVPKNYIFVKKDEDPHISFRRVGIYAGKIDIETQTKSPQSHYFIKFNSPLTEDVYNKLETLDYDCKNNTVGPKSISKQELIKEFNKIF